MTQVRRATPSDASAIAEIHVETWRATYRGVMPQRVLDDLDVHARARAWQRYIGMDELAVFVAEQQRDVVGFANAGESRDEPRVGELYAIYVRPTAWSTGAGLALMDAAATWLRERWSEAVLWVAEQNPRARRFYELYGWRDDGVRKVEEVVPGAEVAEVRYRLSLLGRG